MMKSTWFNFLRYPVACELL